MSIQGHCEVAGVGGFKSHMGSLQSCDGASTMRHICYRVPSNQSILHLPLGSFKNMYTSGHAHTNLKSCS